jgi:hypothetical protein
MERGRQALMMRRTGTSRLRRVGIAAMVALWLTMPAVAQEAIKDGGVLTGTLRLVRTRHPNGTKIEAYQIVSVPRAMPAGRFLRLRQGCHHVSPVHDE